MSQWVDSTAWERAEREGHDVRWSVYQDDELGTIATVSVDGEIVYTGAAPVEFRSQDTP